MTRSPGLVALTRRRFGTPRSAAAVIVVLTMLAALLIAAAPRALSGVVRDEVGFQLDQLSTPSRDLTASVQDMPADFGTGDARLTTVWVEGAAELFGGLQTRLAEIRADATPQVRAMTDEASFFIFSDAFEVAPAVLPATSPTGFVQLIADPLYQQHLRVASGRWPTPWGGNVDAPIELVLTRAAADLMVWPLGEVRAAGITTDVVLVGIVEPDDADAERWQHAEPSVLTGTFFDDGNRRPSATGGGFVDPGSWREIRAAVGTLQYENPRLPEGYSVTHVSTSATIWYPVSASRAADQQPQALLAGLRQLTAQSLSIEPRSDTRARFATDVTNVLESALARSNSTSATLAVAAVGPIAVSVALIVLAAGLIIRRRRTDLLLLSARGTSVVRLRGLLVLEGLLLGVIPAVVATVAAVVLVPTGAGLLPSVLAVMVGFVPAAALALALRSHTLAGGRADLDAPIRSRWSRLMELLVVLLAVLAVGVLMIRGVGTASGGVDPLVVLAPMLATVALGLVAVRLHPLWLAGVLRRAQRGRGLVTMVGAARSLRDPAAGTTAVLAMLVAVAIAVFSSLVLATVDRGAAVAAERSVGGDLQVSGPFFDADTIDAIRALDGVDHVTGFMAADRVSLATGQGRVVAALVVTDVVELSHIQAGLVDGFPADLLDVGALPPQLAASSEVAAAVGLGEASESFTTVDLAAELAALPGAGAGTSWVVMDVRDYAAVSGKGFFPRTLVLDLASDADVTDVAAAISIAVTAPHSVQSLAARTAAIQSSPAVSALRTALLLALVLAVVLSVVALLLVAAVSRDSRSRVTALLRTAGMSRAQGRGIVAWEFLPLGLSALVGGIVLGVILPLLVLVSIDLRPFTGGLGQPGLTVDPGLTTALIAVVIAALACAVIGGVLTARTTSLVTVLRTEEDR